MRIRAQGALALAGMSVLAACGGSTATSTTMQLAATTAAAASIHLVESDTINDLPVDIHAGEVPADRPVVVLFHGGGWLGGDRSSVSALADALAARGLVVFNSAYRTREGGFPESFEDVECAIRYAAARAGEWSSVSDAVWVVGHSAGAHLAAVAALGGDVFDGTCPYDSRAPVTRFAGLSGAYDPTLYDVILAGYFGARLADDPERWEQGSPYTYLGENPDLEWLLAHGAEDDLVPPSASELFHAALVESGYRAELEILPGLTHLDTTDPTRIADLVYDFFTG